jgi:salicylate hydroxylase
MSLNAVITSACVAGMSSAVSLRRAGHRVHICELSAFNNEVGAAMTVPPNAIRAVAARGMDPVASRFVLAPGIMTGAGANLDQLTFTPLGDWAGHMYGMPFNLPAELICRMNETENCKENWWYLLQCCYGIGRRRCRIW